VTRPLIDAVEARGIRARTVLDLGCGVGDLALELVDRGAASGRGFDLSPRSIEAARALAAERGLADRVTFDVGDASKADLPPADVVLLNRAICCYPDVEGLLERSLGAARSVYAFTIPRSSGLVGTMARLQARLGNWWTRRRPAKFGDFQAFVHDVDAVDARVREAGFTPVHAQHLWFAWLLRVYERAAGVPGAQEVSADART
ncbi:MAG TPA: methyltransferase domain-containing protein, partial [Actinomycetota bacterium]